VKVRLRNPDREVELAGGRKIHDVLGELGINPDTVLVIRERELLTREDRVDEADVIEIRPVISGGSGGNRMKCRRCKAPAVVEIRRHNAAFCADCFLRHVREQVKRAIEGYEMFEPSDRILVAVSGGKDSLALWDVLLELGYRADGLYLGLGIGEYSERSHGVARAFAEERDVDLVEVDLARDYGFDVPTAGKRGSRSTCAVCGLSKRYIFNRAAREGGYDVIATGHNLDDEAATLLGNTLRWQTDYIARQSPVLPAEEGFARKVKPLYRLSELETAAFAFLRGIDYVVEECPLVGGNTQLRYKDAMNQLESTSPGTKAQFLFGYLDRAAPLFETQDEVELVGCERCGQPTTGRFCAFCRAQAQILGERLGEPQGGRDEPSDRETAASMSDEVMPVEIYGAVPR
jgi:tRNA-5-methyluridine54 2-sulfurtransferase